MQAPLSLIVMVLFGLSTAHAALITSAAGIQSPSVIDFSRFATDTYLTSTPTDIGNVADGDVTATGSGPFQRILVSIGFTIGGNGEWTPDRNGYVSANSFGGSITFAFNHHPVSAVGGLMNYFIWNEPVLIQALDSHGTLLESHDLGVEAPIITPGGINAGEFRGIARPSADIAAFRFTGPATLLDDLTFVSEPTTMSLTLFGIAALVGVGRWRQCRGVSLSDIDQKRSGRSKSGPSKS